MKKYLILFFSILIFASCTRMAINAANSKATKNQFYQGILELDNSVRKDTENKELFESYENIFNRGKSYYNSTDEIRELFLMEKLYLDLPDNVKQKLPGIYVDINKHRKNGEKIASDLFENTQSMGENTYREKIKKYKQYKKVLTYNPNEKNKVENELKKLDKKVLFLPFITIISSLAGGAVASILLSLSVGEAVAISAGMGWYSFSAIELSKVSVELGGIAFLSNIFRELLAIFLIPVIAKKIGSFESVSVAGATAMDSVLPIINRSNPAEISIISFYSGLLISIIVPILIPILVNIFSL